MILYRQKSYSEIEKSNFEQGNKPTEKKGFLGGVLSGVKKAIKDYYSPEARAKREEERKEKFIKGLEKKADKGTASWDELFYLDNGVWPEEIGHY